MTYSRLMAYVYYVADTVQYSNVIHSFFVCCQVKHLYCTVYCTASKENDCIPQ